jgi:peptide/nickel transport system ATP-binding protein
MSSPLVGSAGLSGNDQPVARMENIVKTYVVYGQEVPAVRGVSLEIGQREVVGIVGESGSGKSTIARIMMGLEAATSGTVWLAGDEVGTRRTRAQRRVAQMVFQDPRSSLNPRMSVLQSVEDFAVVHRMGGRDVRRGLAVKALEQVHLSSTIASRRPPELSSGQLQRVCLARALITNPLLLVADEPTSALDVSVQGQVLNVLDELRENLSMLLISHDMAVIGYLADRVYVMLNGEVVEAGTTEQVLNDPQHDYTKRLLGAALSPITEP